MASTSSLVALTGSELGHFLDFTVRTLGDSPRSRACHVAGLPTSHHRQRQCRQKSTVLSDRSFSRKSRRALSIGQLSIPRGLSVRFQGVPSGSRKTAAVAELSSLTTGQSPTLTADVTDDVAGDEEVDVVVIGAGLAGLAASIELQKSSVPFLLLEASDGVGGRVRTDKVDGFLLDRGFQIFLSAYPEAKEMLDYEALDLKPFYAGALVWFDGSFHRVADPFRHPIDGISSIPNPIGTPLDKALVGYIRLKTLTKSLDDILSSPETTIAERLEEEGFTLKMVNRFFRPFLGGIFFDRELGTTSRLLEFVLRMLALGANTLPAGGIGAISVQLSQSLPSHSIKLNSRVVEISPPGKEESKPTKITLSSGKTIFAKKGVILAVEGPEVKKMFTEKSFEACEDLKVQGVPKSTVCLYFSADKVPIEEPILLLNGTTNGIINNMCFPSIVSPSYAPPGKVLISVSLIGNYPESTDFELENKVRTELEGWFGSTEIRTWKHLKTYRIPYAQPDQRPPTNLKKESKIGNSIYVCGDHRDTSTFDGALVSGKRAAKRLTSETAKISV